MPLYKRKLIVNSSGSMVGRLLVWGTKYMQFIIRLGLNGNVMIVVKSEYRGGDVPVAFSVAVIK